MALDNLGTPLSPGVYMLTTYEGGGVRIDRYIVQTGATTTFHANVQELGYKLVACGQLEFLSLTEDGRVNEYRRMVPGEELVRPPAFRHKMVNLSDDDFVVLKITPWPPPAQARA